MWSWVNRAVDALGEKLFPSVCVGCRAVVARGALPICDGCEETIEKVDGSCCRVCARRYVSGASVVCGACTSSRPAFARATAFSVHGGAVGEAIARFKYGGEESLARALGALARTAIDWGGDGGTFDCVVPVPLHLRRLRARGFNQAALLATHLGLRGVRVFSRALLRVRDTPPQAGLSARERRANVAGAFRIRPGCDWAVVGAQVLLVDDVFTTGSTANECARVLVDAGAARVSVAVVSRAE